jgi:hypothetical protein
LQPGEELRGAEKAAAKGGDRRFERARCRARGIYDEKTATKFHWKCDVKLHAAKLSRSEERAFLAQLALCCAKIYVAAQAMGQGFRRFPRSGPHIRRTVAAALESLQESPQ